MIFIHFLILFVLIFGFMIVEGKKRMEENDKERKKERHNDTTIES
jgi:uncharacterized membrane protein